MCEKDLINICEKSNCLLNMHINFKFQQLNEEFKKELSLQFSHIKMKTINKKLIYYIIISLHDIN